MSERVTPLLNPVLSLQITPAPEARTGGGKGRGSIVTSRLEEQMRTLSAASRALIASRAQLPVFHRKTHLIAHMFAEDSLAPSHVPNDLFHPVHGCQLVAPIRQGYLIEADIEELERLTQAIEHPANYRVQADISRVKTLAPLSINDRLRGRSVEELWNAAVVDVDSTRMFVLWLAPFRDYEAQTALLNQITALSNGRAILPTFAASLDGTSTESAVSDPRNSSIARAMRSYRATGAGRATIRLTSTDALSQIIASGLSFRIDPVRPIKGAQPGTGKHPDMPLDITDAPIVGVIDGGLHASSYSSAEAWRASPLVPDIHADRVHGNGVSSLVVHAHAWNNHRTLPALTCRIGTVQAVAARNSNHVLNEATLLDHLAQAFREHPETKVWNISANQEAPFNGQEISYLGHELQLLARYYGILPVISIGNRSNVSRDGPNAPADCEAGLSVGGRQANLCGQPGDACHVCLPGPGPDGMMKPDLSWFSELRMIGGVTDIGSSYATPLISSIAAHTFSKLKDPTPDIVKALLINAAELDVHDPNLGWGTPFNGTSPWECAHGSVTLTWRAQLSPGYAYYWRDLPIPPEMIKGGKLAGRGRLTAVLKPLVSSTASSNYFATRLETALQYPKGGDDWGNLLGTMKESSLKELEARAEFAKWQPVRRHSRKFEGLKFKGNQFRLYARVYTRDLYQFNYSYQSEVGPQEIAFVLTFWDADGNDTIHNSTVRALGNFVESAVINQEIEIHN